MTAAFVAVALYVLGGYVAHSVIVAVGKPWSKGEADHAIENVLTVVWPLLAVGAMLVDLTVITRRLYRRLRPREG